MSFPVHWDSMYQSTEPLFRSLTDAEEKQFRDWAKENDPPEMKNWTIYHPVCREEWEKRGIKP